MDGCDFDGDTFKTLIDSCEILKAIVIIGNFPSSWPDRHYPKYQRLMVNDMNKLIPHIQQNPSVRNLSFFSSELFEHRNDIISANIELDIFDVTIENDDDIDDIDDVVKIWNELY